MPEPIRRVIGTLSLVGTLSIGCLAIRTSLPPEHNALAADLPIVMIAQKPGEADRGRAVFNGKGVCYYCHGIDGYLDRRPELAADTAALIDQLNPPPADLRNRKTLRLTTDKARFNAIREGHPGTGMFPDTTMSPQELTDTLAYLALLRSGGSAKRK
jgi:mono/diheme cytochrome c family protein